MVGIDVKRLYDMLKNVRKRDLVDLRVDEETLTLKVGSIEYTIGLIDPSAIRKPPKTQELELPAKAVLDAGQFKDAVNLASKVTDEITLRTDENTFILEAKGDMESIKLELGSMDLIEFNGAEARSTFAIEYLKEFNKIASRGDVLTIHLGTDLPARFVYDVADGKLTVEYILAPRINIE
jgi:proliferating cell nuclear antigen